MKTIDLKPLPSFVISILLLAYIVARIFLMPISDDEYITVDLHASQSFWSIITTGQPDLTWAPNNHILNTIMMKLEIMVFGRKDWAVRLHLIAATMISLYFSYKIISRFTTSEIRKASYILIIFFNPYLLDFFGLARGYALSISAFIAAFYYLSEYTDHYATRSLKLIFFWMFISVWSNFSALYLLAGILILISYELLKKKDLETTKQHILIAIIAMSILSIIIFLPLIRTIASGETYGGKSGLFNDCIVNYINQYIHHNPKIERHMVVAPDLKLIQILGFIILLLWVSVQAFSFLYKSSPRANKMHIQTFFLIFFVALISKLLFHFNGTPFPTGRTQLLFSIPFYFGICIALERIILNTRVGYYLLGICLTFLVWHFSYSVTFRNTVEWWQNGDAKYVVSYFKENLDWNSNRKVLNLGAENWQYHSLAFYTEVEFEGKMDIHWTDLSSNQYYDYLVVPNHRHSEVFCEYVKIKEFKFCSLYKLN